MVRRDNLALLRGAALPALFALSVICAGQHCAVAHADDLTSANLSSCMEVHLSASSFTWTGGSIEPEVVNVTNWSLDEDLVKGVGYEVAGYENNKDIGTGCVVLRSLTEGYQGTWRVPFKIVAPPAGAKVFKNLTSDGNVYRMLADGSVALSKYTAKATTAKIGTVKFGGRAFSVDSVDPKAFAGSKATKVTLGKQVRSVSAKAFLKCLKLKSVQIGAGVGKIGASAFKGCPKLKTVTVKSNLLTRAGVKGCLKGSKVKTVKLKGVKSVKKRLYKSYFDKKNCGRAAKVK